MEHEKKCRLAPKLKEVKIMIEATRTINNGILRVTSCGYRLVEKKETKALIRTIDECQKIYDSFEVMSFPGVADIDDEATIIKISNAQIEKKLIRLYRYYKRHFGLTFETEGYSREKLVEINISKICEAIHSWEE